MQSLNLIKPKKETSWGAIWSLTIGVAGLIIAEFLPAGVLTPMAHDLGVTEGMAGQAVSASAIFATVTSLSIAYLTRKLDRKFVAVTLTGFLTCSSVVVATAHSYTFLLLGRVLLGIAVGGFWSLSSAIAIRLVEPEEVPKAMSLIYGGSSFASVLAAPMGSYLGNLIGWRNVFFIAAAVGVAAFVWQLITLPSLTPIGTTKLRTTIDVLRKPRFIIALFAINFVFCGRFASFTYLRPFLEQTTHLNVNWISAVLLIFGLSYFVGNWFAPGMIKRNIRTALIFPPAILAFVALGLLLAGQWLIPTLIFVFIWGSSFGPVAPSWSTWVSRSVPEFLETAGGLYIASIQLAATVGALFGGVVFDRFGSSGVFILSGISWLMSATLVSLFITNPSESKSAENGASITSHDLNRSTSL